MTLGSHQRTIGRSQTRITPRSILEPLGPFDTDPCAAAPRPWDCAAKNITEAEDSLAMDWRDFGRVWLNPPFDRRVVGRFIELMRRHDRGIALVHVRTETEWFLPIWHAASALLFLAGRYIFHTPDGSLCKIENPSSKHFGKAANSGAPLLLAAFGHADADVLCLCGIDGHFVPLRFPRGFIIAAIEPSWREAVRAFLKDRGIVSLAEVYAFFADKPKARRNPTWKAKLRQTLQRTAKNTGRGEWEAVAA